MSFERILTGLAVAPAPNLGFTRHELSLILDVYGRMVARGEWHDYAIDQGTDRAVFSIFRGAAGHPVFRVEKRWKGGREADYAVVGMDGRIFRQGRDLRQVLSVLGRRTLRLVD